MAGLKHSFTRLKSQKASLFCRKPHLGATLRSHTCKRGRKARPFQRLNLCCLESVKRCLFLGFIDPKDTGLAEHRNTLPLYLKMNVASGGCKNRIHRNIDKALRQGILRIG